MEFYIFYLSMMYALEDMEQFIPKNRYTPFIGIVYGITLWAVLFILQGFGIYRMAKNRDFKNKVLAFVPFVNIWYMGKLAGECQFFSQRVKRAGMYAMIMQIATTLFAFAVVAAEAYLWFYHGVPEVDTMGYYYWPGLTDNFLYKFYELSGYVFWILNLLYKIFFLVLVMGLYKKYEPRSYVVLSMVSLFVPMSRFIIIFVLRNRNAVDYNAYMRARQEAYFRQQQQYYNSYNNPYNRQGGYGNGQYGQNPYGQPQQNAGEPFSEFGGQSKGESPFEEFEDSDRFFS